jgi:hypothetical protein
MLVKKIIKSRPTVLLDECQTVFGGSDRQIRGILVSGNRVDENYEAKGGAETVPVFCPKAFAGMRILPAAIAERCINIVLSPNTGDTQTWGFVSKIALKEAEAVVAPDSQMGGPQSPRSHQCQSLVPLTHFLKNSPAASRTCSNLCFT